MCKPRGFKGTYQFQEKVNDWDVVVQQSQMEKGVCLNLVTIGANVVQLTVCFEAVVKEQRDHITFAKKDSKVEGCHLKVPVGVFDI